MAPLKYLCAENFLFNFELSLTPPINNEPLRLKLFSLNISLPRKNRFTYIFKLVLALHYLIFTKHFFICVEKHFEL